MNYCIHLKKKKNKPYCNVIKKEISLFQCRECINKEYKTHDYNRQCTKTQNNKKMRVKSSELAKLERSRYSVFTDNKDKCMFCPATTNLTWHEIYAGRNRQNSMKDGLCLRMCLLCHKKKQEDTQFNEFWHHKAQLYYEQNIGDRKQFLARYRRSYLK